MEYPKFKVCVRCMTYNQSKYITDTMNGFCQQKTSFPFVCTILDDASSDGEQDVIKKYIEDNFDLSVDAVSYQRETNYAYITYAQHKINRNCYFALLFLKENHYSKNMDSIHYLAEWQNNVDYMAICEGDDYWIDSLKLQKQVDYMESHLNCGMCYAQVYYLEEKLHVINNNPVGGDYESFEKFMRKNPVPTLTALVRFEYEKRYITEINPSQHGWAMGDYPRWIWYAHECDIHFEPTVFGIYRVLEDSASHSRSFEKIKKFIESGFQIRKFFAYYYGRPELYHDNDRVYNLLCEAYRFKNKEKVIEYFKALRPKTIKSIVKYVQSLFF